MIDDVSEDEAKERGPDDITKDSLIKTAKMKAKAKSKKYLFYPHIVFWSRQIITLTLYFM